MVTSAAFERRRVVDRRRGSERRSTLERRHRGGGRFASRESAAEHLRNALQLLTPLSLTGGTQISAALARLKTALAVLEQTN